MNVQRVMQVSLGVSVCLTLVKVGAYFLTGSVAILGDALESLVHIAAVAFSTVAVGWAEKPADRDHHYGHAKVVYAATGFEGGMIVVAALFIAYSAAHHWGQTPDALGKGILLTLAAIAINSALGGWILYRARRDKSSILASNGKHTLVDVWTSVGVIVGLTLTRLSGWNYWDGICALAVAANITWTGSRLMYQSFHGLLGRSHSSEHEPLFEAATALAREQGLEVHHLRHHPVGDFHILDCHLSFPDDTSIKEAHQRSTAYEEALKAANSQILEVNTHLEPASEREHE